MKYSVDIIRSWEDIKDAFFLLIREGMYLHANPPKNWDMSKVFILLENSSRNAMILDIGCGGGHTLRLLERMKFKNVFGIDLYPLDSGHETTVYLKDKFMSYFYKIRDGVRYRVLRGDGVETKFKDNCFDVITSISVIEHGVPLDAFFRECNRLLKKGGILFLTTDYSYKKIETNTDWTIFNEDGVNSIVTIAKDHGFILDGKRKKLGKNEGITISSTGLKEPYTFISLCFKKEE